MSFISLFFQNSSKNEYKFWKRENMFRKTKLVPPYVQSATKLIQIYHLIYIFSNNIVFQNRVLVWSIN